MMCLLTETRANRIRNYEIRNGILLEEKDEHTVFARSLEQGSYILVTRIMFPCSRVVVNVRQKQMFL